MLISFRLTSPHAGSSVGRANSEAAPSAKAKPGRHLCLYSEAPKIGVLIGLREPVAAHHLPQRIVPEGARATGRALRRGGLQLLGGAVALRALWQEAHDSCLVGAVVRKRHVEMRRGNAPRV